MEQLKAKLKKQGGFTMVELLIVVAIIAILVAVSIPMMNQALEKSRHAVDQANARDAIGLASAKYMTDPVGAVGGTKAAAGTGKTWYYHVDDTTHLGSLTDTAADGVDAKCECSATKPAKLFVTIKPPADTDPDTPQIEVAWKFTGASGATGIKAEATVDSGSTAITP